MDNVKREPTKDCEAIGNKHDYRTDGECWHCLTTCEHDIDWDSDSAPCCVICGLIPEPNEPEPMED